MTSWLRAADPTRGLIEAKDPCKAKGVPDHYHETNSASSQLAPLWACVAAALLEGKTPDAEACRNQKGQSTKVDVMLTAITRAVSPSINACELTFHLRQEIDVARAAIQHRAYEECLRELGVRVISLAEEPDLPDAVFVEDAAIVVDEVAIMTRMGAASRRTETESLARALSEYRPLSLWNRLRRSTAET